MVVYICYSVAKSCPTLQHHGLWSTPGFPALLYLLEFAETHVHWFGDVIQPSHPLSSPSPPVLSLSQYQGLFLSQLFTWGGQIIGASASASVLPMYIRGWFPLGSTGLISLLSTGLSKVFSSTTVCQSWSPNLPTPNPFPMSTSTYSCVSIPALKIGSYF